MSDILVDIPVVFLDRRRMKAARAWRCVMELPLRENLPEVLTAMIETQVRVEIYGEVAVVIDPAFIFDVPTAKGGKFQLMIETVYEHQSSKGQLLTALVGKSAKLTISPPSGEPEPAIGNQSVIADPSQQTGDINEQSLRGLHISFFRNTRFQEYVQYVSNTAVGDEATCKAAFKGVFNVASCKHIMQADFDQFLKEFNVWLNNKGAASGR